MSKLYAVLAREPVLLGAFVSAAAFLVVHGSGGQAVIVAGIAWVVRLLSTSTVKAKENEDKAHSAGYDKAVAEVSSLAAPPAARPVIVPPPLPQVPLGPVD